MTKISLLISSLALAAFTISCATHVGYRAYDRDRGDYHVWAPQETTYYNQWEVETHRPSRDYRHLNRHDQDDYWNWRHAHSDHH